LRRFENLNRSARNTSLDLHRQTLLRFSMDSLSIRSDDTCFPCLRRRPQYNLPCGHCVCENCVRSFGMKNQYNPWLFEVDSCFFCSLTTCGVTVKTLPPTAGIRVLTLDGGGVRGLTALEFLRHLQYKIGLPYPVQENFDVAFGTSSGEACNPRSQSSANIKTRRDHCSSIVRQRLVGRAMYRALLALLSQDPYSA
jgi:hypothetical protein